MIPKIILGNTCICKSSKYSKPIHSDKKNSLKEVLIYATVLTDALNISAADLWRCFEPVFNKDKKEKISKKFKEKSNYLLKVFRSLNIVFPCSKWQVEMVCLSEQFVQCC